MTVLCQTGTIDPLHRTLAIDTCLAAGQLQVVIPDHRTTMLFTARSPAFAPVLREADPQTNNVVRTEHFSAHQPWLVLTYLRHSALTASWETLCAVTEQALLDHLRDLRSIQIAQLLYMAPPRRGPKKRWARHQIRLIERGRSGISHVSVYTDDRGEQFCFDAPAVDPETVTHRRQVLNVCPYQYFD